MPALPGAHRAGRSGLAAIVQASACSRPPDPKSRIFMNTLLRPLSGLDPPSQYISISLGVCRLLNLAPVCAEPHERTAPQSSRIYGQRAVAALKRMVEDIFGFVRVRGEISGRSCTIIQRPCLFRSQGRKMPCSRRDLAAHRGRRQAQPSRGWRWCSPAADHLSGSSHYQIIVEQLELAGLGALMALLEERKRSSRPKACSTRRARSCCLFCPT